MSRAESRKKIRAEARIWLNPNPTTPIEKARRVVGSIVEVLQEEKFVQDVGITCGEPFKGGSLGQGTAVPHNYDIDLVLYSEGITAEDLTGKKKDGGDYYIDRIGKYLKQQLHGKYTFIKSYLKLSITFNYEDPEYDVSIDVDLLLSPLFKEHHDYLKFLRGVIDSEDRRLFSAGASKWQTEFIKKQHNWVKEFCRRAKAWRIKAWEGNEEGRPKSYLLCLLVIVAYNRVPVIPGLKRKMKSYAPQMTVEFRKLVKEIESKPDLDLSIPGTDRRLQEMYKDLLDKPPRIIDPANPSNNLYKSGISKTPGGKKWSSFAAEVDSLDLALPYSAYV